MEIPKGYILPQVRPPEKDFDIEAVGDKFVEDVTEKIPVETVDIYQYQISKIALHTGILFVVLWIIGWIALGLFTVAKTHKSLLVIFVAYIVFVIVEIFNTDIYVSSTEIENQKVSMVEELSMVVFGSLALIFVFSKDIIPSLAIPSYMVRVMYLSLFISCLPLLFVQTSKDATSYYNLNILKSNIHNISVFLFLVFLLFLITSRMS